MRASCNRRQWMATAAAASLGPVLYRPAKAAVSPPRMNFGLVTYQWAKDWDLPTLISNCETAKVYGVELRTTHAHGVEPSLSKSQRRDVRRRFADSPVELVGVGSDERFDNPDPQIVRAAIESAKRFVELSHDVGGTGVKVKPDRFHPGVPREQTIEQIGKALNEVAKHASGYGQQVRIEVHGQCAQLPTMQAIMEVATDENAVICWNSNAQDLEAPGLEHNFNLVRQRFGHTCHVRPFDTPDYPYKELVSLLVRSNYDGWVMLESGDVPPNPVAELARQGLLFTKLVAETQA